MKKEKPEPVILEHKLFGCGLVMSVRILQSGACVADLRFDDEIERTVQLDPRYWLSNVADLAPTPPKPPRRVRKKPAQPRRSGGISHQPQERHGEHND